MTRHCSRLITAMLFTGLFVTACTDDDPNAGPDAEFVLEATIQHAAFADGVAYVINSEGLLKGSIGEVAPSLVDANGVDVAAVGDTLAWLSRSGDIHEIKPGGADTVVDDVPGTGVRLARAGEMAAVAFRRSTDLNPKTIALGKVTRLKGAVLDYPLSLVAVDQESGYFTAAKQVGKLAFGTVTPVILAEATNATSSAYAFQALAAADGKAYALERFANQSWALLALGPQAGDRVVLFQSDGNCDFAGGHSLAIDGTHAYVVAAFENDDNPNLACGTTTALIRIPLAGGVHERLYQRPSQDLSPDKVFAVDASHIYFGVPAVGGRNSNDRLMRISKP